MFDVQNPHPQAISWQDDIPGVEGNEGWYWDTEAYRVILLNGLWWDDNKDAPHRGKGDLLNALRAYPELYKGAKGHGGFMHYATMALHTLIEQGIVVKYRPILLCGHSMGAGIAGFLAMFLRDEGYSVVNVVMYGLPTIWGDKRMCWLFGEDFPEAKAFTVGNDYTQHLWLVGLFFGLKSPVKVSKVYRKYKNLIEWLRSPVDDHWPWIAKDYLPRPEEV